MSIKCQVKNLTNDTLIFLQKTKNKKAAHARHSHVKSDAVCYLNMTHLQSVKNYIVMFIHIFTIC